MDFLRDLMMVPYLILFMSIIIIFYELAQFLIKKNKKIGLEIKLLEKELGEEK